MSKTKLEAAIARGLVSVATAPNHHVIGRFIRGPWGWDYYCYCWTPEGYWLFPVRRHSDKSWSKLHERRACISERAIDRTFHPIIDDGWSLRARYNHGPVAPFDEVIAPAVKRLGDAIALALNDELDIERHQ